MSCMGVIKSIRSGERGGGVFAESRRQLALVYRRPHVNSPASQQEHSQAEILLSTATIHCFHRELIEK